MACENISTKKIDYYVNMKKCLIIDLREEKKYKNMHIKNAINIPYESIGKSMTFKFNEVIINGKSYGKEYVFILYCERGSQSLMVCSTMAKRGFNVKNVIGGISQYRGENLIIKK